MHLTIDEQKKYYDSRWSESGYIGKFGLNRLIAILQLLNFTNLDQSTKLLDLGSGKGWLTSILSEFAPITGIELSHQAVENAMLKYPSVKFINGNIFEIPFEKSSFDIVVSQEVIEHVEDQDKYISIVAHCLKKGGFLILTTPNERNFRYWTESQLKSWNLQPIENWLNARELRKILEKDFEIVILKTIIPFWGNKGVYKLLNSPKLNLALNSVGLKNLKNYMLLKLGLGLHIVLLAKRIY